MDPEIENLQFEIKGALFQLTADQLMQISDFLEISGTSRARIAGKTCNALVSYIIRHVEREELSELEDEGMSELLSLMDMIKTLQDPNKTNMQENTKNRDEQEKLKSELEQLKFMVQQKEMEMHKLTNREYMTSNQTIPVCTTPSSASSPSWRKDYKISGQIGEPGQKDRLTFSSLARQIENGLSKGYPESEIVDAVIRAIVPGLQLRSYLEGKSDLSLPTLRRILRSHYQERSATELYKQLTTEAQGNKETPQNFLIRAMDLRQKILFASQEAESSLKYDPALVQSMFMHTILTGLQNDNIKTDLQPYLLQPATSDELLLERLNMACANEKERQDKKRQTAPQRHPAVHAIQSSDLNGDKKLTSKQTITMLTPDVLSDLKEIKADIVLLKDLKAEVSQIRESIQQPETGPKPHPPIGKEIDNQAAHHQHYFRPQFMAWDQGPPAFHQSGGAPPGYQAVGGPRVTGTAQFQQRFAPQRYPMPRGRPKCFACQQRGEEYCQHCFRCGSSEHFRAGCRGYRGFPNAERGTPLNETRLPPRDRE
ncbi:uncharacterized protein LOC117152945 [Anabas testudineus]|uniref:uncharacterized protein LOC117152945 n=1 Tax=Anabas testudineus TaxID=64144 RepID=UPI00143DEF1A|nr:uncharacterized protein LOC117152945 [Anabas testudineus]